MLLREAPQGQSASTTSAASKDARGVAQAAAVEAPYAKLEQLEPGIARILAHNPSAFTYYGTQTYLIGSSEVAVIDPGPEVITPPLAAVNSSKASRNCSGTWSRVTMGRRAIALLLL